MLYVDPKDIKMCMKVVETELKKRDITVNESVLKDITKDIMNISYAKGGDYSNRSVSAFAEVYIERGLYNKFLRRENGSSS